MFRQEANGAGPEYRVVRLGPNVPDGFALDVLILKAIKRNLYERGRRKPVPLVDLEAEVSEVTVARTRNGARVVFSCGKELQIERLDQGSSVSGSHLHIGYREYLRKRQEINNVKCW